MKDYIGILYKYMFKAGQDKDLKAEHLLIGLALLTFGPVIIGAIIFFILHKLGIT